MMRFSLFILVIIGLVFLYSCNSIDSENDNRLLTDLEIDDFILTNYIGDARSLYFSEILTNPKHPDYNNPVLDSTGIMEVLKIIQAVYNLNSPESDTIFNYYKIHGYYCYSFSSISLRVYSEFPEIQNLAESKIPTGNTKLDKILAKYEFDSVRVSYNYPNFPWLSIYTKKEFNMIPVENEFGNLTQVDIAEFNKGCIGDGNTIEMERKNGVAVITFSIGSGDCPAGCIYHKYWEFRVVAGMAEFLQSYEN